MNAKAMIPLVVAIALGGVAAKVGRDMLNRKEPAKAVTVNVTQCVVAKENIPPGTALRAENLIAKTMPDSALTPGAFRDSRALMNRVLTMPVMKDQPILENMLAPEGTSRGLTAIVPDGMRAVTLEVNEVSGIAGMLVPGCRIDIVTTLAGDGGGMVARTIARNLQIIAVGRKFSDGNKDGPKDDGMEPPARTVTLLVNPKEAQLVDLAAHTGSPRLVLRGSRDSRTDLQEDAEAGVTLAELRGGPGDRSGMGGFLTRLIETVSRNPTTRPGAMVEASAPTTKPSDSMRLVTIIRATKEQAVQIERRVEPKAGLVETDKAELPGN